MLTTFLIAISSLAAPAASAPAPKVLGTEPSRASSPSEGIRSRDVDASRTVARETGGGQRDGFIRGLRGEILGPDGAAADKTLGGTLDSGFSPPWSIRPYVLNTYEVTLTGLESGWEEKFLLAVPRRPASPAPLLVVFHAWGGLHTELTDRTEFMDAIQRGWYVLCPLGAHQFNFAIEYAQRNVEAALDWVTTYIDIDPDRIYGVGFSMGGGMATSYAARHLDPNHARFAAVINHTGTASIRDVYNESADTSMLEHELMFGGSPDEYPFAYARASSIDLYPDGVVSGLNDLARNLLHIPVMTFSVDRDPNTYLLEQCDSFYGHTLALGGSPTYTEVPGNKHRWTTLDVDDVLDYFEPIRYQDPAFGVPCRVLVDRDANWFHFGVFQRLGDRFSYFRWTLDATNNRVVLDQLSNVRMIDFHPVDLGLPHATQPLEVMVNVADGLGTLDVEVHGYSWRPAAVVRTGVPTADWTYDAARGVVILHETVGVGYPRWTILP